MNQPVLSKEMYDKLVKMAREDCFYDDDDEDVIVDDYAGGNIDDAFAVGERAGEIMLARKILESCGLAW